LDEIAEQKKTVPIARHTQNRSPETRRLATLTRLLANANKLSLKLVWWL
jgi:hypothetical protein